MNKDKWLATIVHLITFIFAIIVGFFWSMGSKYYKYLSMLSLSQLTNCKLDLISLVFISAMCISVYDAINVMLYSTKFIIDFKTRKKDIQSIKTIVFWASALVVGICTMYIIIFSYLGRI